MANDSESQNRPRKEMTPTAKYLNMAIMLIILGVSAYIIARIVNDLGVVLFTYHPTFMVLGVRFMECSRITSLCFVDYC